MLDGFSDQGASLRGLRQAGARLLPVVQNGEREAELVMLWHLCSALDELDYGVTALDGSAHETQQSSGLLECLRDGIWPAPASSTRWSVMPAALGLHALTEQAEAPADAQDSLGHAFVDSDALVTYANVSTLIRLLAGSEARLLLMVQPEARSVLNTYQTVKYLHAAGLRASVATLVDERDAAHTARARQAHDSLRACVRQHLSQDIESLLIRYPSSLLWPTEDICGLALRLMETAVQLGGAGLPRTAPAPLSAGPALKHTEDPSALWPSQPSLPSAQSQGHPQGH
jgi:hypothetical protein